MGDPRETKEQDKNKANILYSAPLHTVVLALKFKNLTSCPPDSACLITLLTTTQPYINNRLVGIFLYNFRPTVSLDVISLVASSCGYYRGQIEHCAAPSFAVHVATQRARAKRRQHCHPPRTQPVAHRRERHCRGPRLPPRRGTAQAPHGGSNDSIASHSS